MTFQAPEGATRLEIHAYRLTDGAWENLGGGAISREEEESAEEWKGNIALRLLEDYALELRIQSQGVSAYTTDSLVLDRELSGWSQQFLTRPQEIALGKEIPVLLRLGTSGNTLRTHDLPDFFDPQAFEDLELAQAVTVTFQ